MFKKLGREIKDKKFSKDTDGKILLLQLTFHIEINWIPNAYQEEKKVLWITDLMWKANFNVYRGGYRSIS